MSELEKVTAKIKQKALDTITKKRFGGIISTNEKVVRLSDVLGALGEWQKTVEKLFENRPKITDEKYLKGISSDRERLRKHIQQFIDDDYDYWANVKRELGLK